VSRARRSSLLSPILTNTRLLSPAWICSVDDLAKEELDSTLQDPSKIAELIMERLSHTNADGRSGVCVSIYAKRGYGKSHLVKILFTVSALKTAFDEVYVLSPLFATKDANGYEYIPEARRLEFTAAKLTALRQMQAERMKAAGAKGKVKKIAIIMDDCAVDGSRSKAKEEVKTIAANGRHYNLSLFILTQDPNNMLSPTVKSNCELFIFGSMSPSNLKTVYPYLGLHYNTEKMLGSFINVHMKAHTFAVTRLYWEEDAPVIFLVKADAPKPTAGNIFGNLFASSGGGSGAASSESPVAVLTTGSSPSTVSSPPPTALTIAPSSAVVSFPPPTALIAGGMDLEDSASGSLLPEVGFESLGLSENPIDARMSTVRALVAQNTIIKLSPSKVRDAVKVLRSFPVPSAFNTICALNDATTGSGDMALAGWDAMMAQGCTMQDVATARSGGVEGMMSVGFAETSESLALQLLELSKEEHRLSGRPFAILTGSRLLEDINVQALVRSAQGEFNLQAVWLPPQRFGCSLMWLCCRLSPHGASHFMLLEELVGILEAYKAAAAAAGKPADPSSDDDDEL
jgi:hypothetical protein